MKKSLNKPKNNIQKSRSQAFLISRDHFRNKDEIKREKYLQFLEYIRIPKSQRSLKHNLLIKEYLCKSITYFKNLCTNSSPEKIFKIISILNYEEFPSGKNIINYGEDSDNFFIIIKGKVAIYKLFPKTKKMTIREYTSYLQKIINIEKNQIKLQRIKSYNSLINHFPLIKVDFDPYFVPCNNNKKSFIIEDERKLCELTIGDSFGETALIRREPRNATVKSIDDCILLVVEKNEYLKNIKEMEEKDINDGLKLFRVNFPIFEFWNSAKCSNFLSGLITETFYKNDFVYKQNSFPDGVYLIKEGIFEIIIDMNLKDYENFIEYIYDISFSIIPNIEDKVLWKIDRLFDFVQKAFNEYKSPLNLKSKKKFILSNNDEEKKNPIEHILNEEQINIEKNVFTIRLNSLNPPDIFGLIENIELKQRLYSIKCISKKGIVQKFPFYEFLQLIPKDKKNLMILQNKICEQKKELLVRLKQNMEMKINLLNDKIKTDYQKIFEKYYPFQRKKLSNELRNISENKANKKLKILTKNRNKKINIRNFDSPLKSSYCFSLSKKFKNTIIDYSEDSLNKYTNNFLKETISSGINKNLFEDFKEKENNDLKYKRICSPKIQNLRINFKKFYQIFSVNNNDKEIKYKDITKNRNNSTKKGAKFFIDRNFNIKNNLFPNISLINKKTNMK